MPTGWAPSATSGSAAGWTSPGPPARTYTTTQADVGQVLRVVASYTDGQGTPRAWPAPTPPRSPTSTTRPPAASRSTTPRRRRARRSPPATPWPMPMAWAPSATSGSAAGSTSSAPPAPTYTTTQADVGSVLRVVASYTDGAGHGRERGQRRHRGGHQRQRRAHRQRHDRRHHADPRARRSPPSNTLADADGLGTISYQWQRGGVDIAGATGATYTTTQADVGTVLRVIASYTDGAGHGRERGQRRHRRGDQRQRRAHRQRRPSTTPRRPKGRRSPPRTPWPTPMAWAPSATSGSAAGWTSPAPPVPPTPRRRPMSASAAGDRQLHRRAGHGRSPWPAPTPPRSPTSTTRRPAASPSTTPRRPRARRSPQRTPWPTPMAWAAISYQWQRGGVDIAGATGATYTTDPGRRRPVAAGGRQLHRRPGHGRERGQRRHRGGHQRQRRAHRQRHHRRHHADPRARRSPRRTPWPMPTAWAPSATNGSAAGSISPAPPAPTYTTTQADVGQTLRVVASYTDGQGTAESVASADTAAVTNVNDAPDRQRHHRRHHADPRPDAHRQRTRWPTPTAWARSATSGSAAASISPAPPAPPTPPTQADVGQSLRVVASYTDGQGTAESVASADTAAVTQRQRRPDRQRHHRRHHADARPDADRRHHGCRCRRPGRASATSGSAAVSTSPAPPAPPTPRRRPMSAQHAACVASYTDGAGHARDRDQRQTRPRWPTSTMRRPAASPSTTPRPTQGQTLTASNTLADADGLGTISYQWQRGGVDIAGATGATYTTTQADVGSALRVIASYTDGQGTAESVASADTAAVTNVNDAPTGSVDHRRHHPDARPDAHRLEHAGRCRRPGHHQLPVAARRGGHRRRHRRHLHHDAGRRRPDAAGDRQLHRRRKARPRAWPQRRHGGGRQRQRCARPAASPSTTPRRPKGQTLTASNTLADADGLGTISYQWQRGGVDIAGATGVDLHDDAGRRGSAAARGRQLHRRAGHGGERGQRGHGAVTNVNDAPDRQRHHRRHHADPGPDAHRIEHPGRCRRAGHHQLPVAARRGRHRRRDRRHLHHYGEADVGSTLRRGRQLHRRAGHGRDR